jgi:hypothetical protein
VAKKNKSKSQTPVESTAPISANDSPFALTGNIPYSPREKRFVWAGWLLLALLSLVVIPVSPMARQWGSWDAMHSGRRFAEEGFFASKLQPIWSPSNGAPTYITYTHYPPLPYWGAGIVESFVSTPDARIRAVNHLIRLLGVSVLPLAYVLMRRLNCSIASGLLVVIITASTTAILTYTKRDGSMWRELATQAVFYGWVVPFLLGSVIFYLQAIRPDNKKPFLPAFLGTLCCLGAALCAYQAWSWYPTMLIALFFTGAYAGTGVDKKIQRKRIFWIWFAACWTIALAIAIRVGINYWHFGSMHAVYRDFVEAYQFRSTGVTDLTVKENAVNYFESTPLSSSRLSLYWEFVKVFPVGMAKVCLPEGAAGWCILSLMAALGITGFAMRKRIASGLNANTPETSPDAAPKINRRGVLLALALAPLTFIVVTPRIAVDQWQGETFWMLPAWIALCGITMSYGLSLLELIGKRLAEFRRHIAVAITFVALASISLSMVSVTRLEIDDELISIEQAEKIAAAIKDYDGLIFTNLPNHNPFMFCLPLNTKASVKPTRDFKHFKIDGPVALLVDSRLDFKRFLGPEADNRPGFEARWDIVRKEVPNLPQPFVFLIMTPKPSAKPATSTAAPL